MFGPAGAAHASPTTLDKVGFVNDTIQDGQFALLSVEWSMQGTASNPVTITVALPPELVGYDDSFSTFDPDGQKSGDCVVSGTQVACTVDPTYVQQNPEQLSGTIKFYAISSLKNTETIQHIFIVGGFALPVTVQPNPELCTGECTFTGNDVYKVGYYFTAPEEIVWVVGLPAGPQGLQAGQTVTVEDPFDSAAFQILDGFPRVDEARSVIRNSFGAEEGNFNALTDPVTVTSNGNQVQFTSNPGLGTDASLPAGERGLDGSLYRVVWRVKVLDDGAAGTYSNTASYTIASGPSIPVSGNAERFGGSGTAVGTDTGTTVPSVSVGDYVWFDTLSDGLQEGSDVPLKDVALTLTGPDGKQVTDINGTPVATTTTDAAGKYLFPNLPVLPAGQHYTVTVTTPAGYTATTPGAGNDRAVDSSTGSAESTDLTTDGAEDLTLDFGFVKAAVTPTPTVTPAPIAVPTLANTGVEIEPAFLIVGALLLLVAGVAMTMATRRSDRES